MHASTSDGSFRAARIFLVIGATIGTHPFLIVLSGPLYLIGLILLYRADVPDRRRWLWVFGTLAGIVIAWGLIVGGSLWLGI